MGETERLNVRTTLLPIYVLVIAGSILVFGLMLIYSQRRVLVLLLVGLLIGCLVFLHPSYASIAGQVAVFGILLVAIASFLNWLVRQASRSASALTPTVVKTELPYATGLGSFAIGQGSTTLAAGSSHLDGGKSS